VSANPADDLLTFTVELGLIALAMTLLMTSGEFDLSMGAVIATQVVMAGNLIGQDEDRILPVMVLMIAVGALIGFLNGVGTTLLKVPSFIVTLGTLNIAFALTHIYSEDQTISGLPSALTFFGNTFQVGQTDITYGTASEFGFDFLRDNLVVDLAICVKTFSSVLARPGR
jgi:ribose/xylose/arabinose/galactoside ABC-type transport system permease subunit